MKTFLFAAMPAVSVSCTDDDPEFVSIWGMVHQCIGELVYTSLQAVTGVPAFTLWVE